MVFSEKQVLELLEKNGRLSFLSLVKMLKIKPVYNKNFSLFLNNLKNSGKLWYSKRYDCYFIPRLLNNFETEFIVNNKGMSFCFFTNEQGIEKKALIFNNHLNALKNDTINVNVYHDIDEGFYFGIIQSIVKRKNKYIFAQVNNQKEIKPLYFSQDINFLYEKDSLEPNTFVKFKIKEIKKDLIILDIDKQLSKINEPYSDIELLIEHADVEKEFSNEIEKELLDIPDKVENEKEFNRIDLTNEMIITIDGKKTKDFDDAINVKKEGNNFILSVHIADVAYYVKEDSAIDLEARKRGTSIYLIDKVIPMLPEKLSNGICSLNPNVKRYTLSLEAKIDKYGNTIEKKIFPAMIESKYRLTYNQVANIENDEIINSNEELKKMLLNAYELSDILLLKKQKEGYVDFEIEEPIIELDKQTGKTINIKKKQRLSSEILIENFMVFANETISKMVADLDVVSIYRIHDIPSEEKIESFKSFMKVLNINNLEYSNIKNPVYFSKMVQSLKKKRFDNLIKMSLLRTMQKASYSSKNIGHFGLASKHYSHFTSPIRRYPDLLLHRIIWEIFFKKNKEYSNNHYNKIEEIAKSSSNSEIRATELERKVNDVKKAEFYENQINQIKEATIVSIQKFGIFVEFEDMTNSLIHISSITNSKEYEIKEDLSILKLVDREYKIGQIVKVKIINVSKLDGKIDSILL